MYYKVIILEIKEECCLALTEDGAVIRIKRKEGLGEGDKVYVLDEDLYQGAAAPKNQVVLPFTRGKKVRKSYLQKFTAVAAAVMVCIASLLVPQMADPAYAAVSFDGEKSIQVKVDKEGKVVDAVSPDQTVSEEELAALKDKPLRQLQNMVGELNEKDGGIIVIAYAGLKGDLDQSFKKDVNDIFGSGKILCLEGSKDDVKAAEKAGKSLGMYMIEKAVSENQLDQLLKGASKEQIVKFLKKHGELIPEEAAKKILQAAKEKSDGREDSDLDDDDDRGQDFDDDDDRDDEDDRIVPSAGDKVDDDDRDQDQGDDGGESWDPADQDDDDMKAEEPDDGGNDQDEDGNEVED